MEIRSVLSSVSNNKLFKDSFWAVLGNGLGSALMLLAGIVIARILGKDVYGEYGLVKSTMFYMASFATFGLGFTSTKYIASLAEIERCFIKCIARDSLSITLLFSGTISLILFVFAKPLALFVEDASLVVAFRSLSIIVVFKAITTTQIGLLSGIKEFFTIGRNSALSGFFLLAICVPLSYYGGLKGSLIALLLSQVFNALLNFSSIRKHILIGECQINKSFKKELIKFSFPVALQESSFTICHWIAIMILTKYSSSGELALYSAAAQWNAIVIMVPSLLSNVVLSYLSSSTKDQVCHNIMVKRMLFINCMCSIIPLIIVWLFANQISSFYGDTFTGLPNVIRLLVSVTVFETCASVFKFEFLSLGKTWQLFGIRVFRDIALLLSTLFLFYKTGGEFGALKFSAIYVSAGVLYFTTTLVYYSFFIRRRSALKR